MSGDTEPTNRHLESLLVAGDRTNLISIVAALVLIGTFGLSVGPLGVAAAVVTALIWYAIGTPYAVAVAHILLVVLVSAGSDPVSFAVAEVGILVLLFAPAGRADAPLRIIVGTITGLLVLGGVTWLAVYSQPLRLATAISIGAVVLTSYALYRYGLVALGLIDDANQTQLSGDDE